MAAQNAPSVLWALLGLDGRIGREVFWLSLFFVNCMSVVVLPPIPPAMMENGATPGEVLEMWIATNPLLIVVTVAASWIFIALCIKRLHDRGLTGWLSLVLLIPGIGIAAFLVIGLIPGTKGPNSFGPATNTRSS